MTANNNQPNMYYRTSFHRGQESYEFISKLLVS
jgi:hypothetical protein